MRTYTRSHGRSQASLCLRRTCRSLPLVVTVKATGGGGPGGRPGTPSPPPSPLSKPPDREPQQRRQQQQPQQQNPESESRRRAELKARLRQLVSKVNAAALPGPADLASLYGAIRELRALNPTPDSATSDLINGRWVLLYTASSTTLERAAAAVAPAPTAGGSSSNSSGGDFGGGGYGGYGSGLEAALSPLQLANDVAYRFFYTYVPVLAGAAVGARGAPSSGPVKPRGNFQVFDTRAGRVENQARFEVGGRLCCVNVNGTAEVVQGPVGRPRQRLRAVFTSFDLLVDGERRLSLPLSLLNPVGFVDTPYLDDEIRISVGDKGSVFIAARESVRQDGDGDGGGGGASGGGGSGGSGSRSRS